MPKKMQVSPRKVETKKTAIPSQLLKTNTIMARKTSTARLRLLYFIFVMSLEKIFARKIVRKKAKTPAKKIAARIIVRFDSVKSGISLPIATAAPVLAF